MYGIRERKMSTTIPMIICIVVLLTATSAMAIVPAQAAPSDKAAPYNKVCKQPLSNTEFPDWIKQNVTGAEGIVIFNQPEGSVCLTITVIVHGLPEGTYDVWLWAGFYDGYFSPSCNYSLPNHFNATDVDWNSGGIGSYARIATITVGTNGNGAAHYNMRAADIDPQNYRLFIWIADGEPILERTYLISTPDYEGYYANVSLYLP